MLTTFGRPVSWGPTQQHRRAPPGRLFAPCKRCTAQQPVHGCSRLSRPHRGGVLAAVAEAAEAEAAPRAPEADFFALVSSASFLLNDVQNEALAEQLRERRRLYKEQGKQLDFCIVPEPTWLEEEFPAEAREVARPCVALVSTDRMWITFMKLRLDRVVKLSLGRRTAEAAFSSGGAVPDFPPLDRDKWTAPYAPYRPGWWKDFLPAEILAEKN